LATFAVVTTGRGPEVVVGDDAGAAEVVVDGVLAEDPQAAARIPARGIRPRASRRRER
jgi:hypothetical protein